MGQNDNGLQNSPFGNPVVPTPSATEGDQGIGGDLDIGGGPQGVISSPWEDTPVPVPSQTVESGPFGNPSKFSSVDGSTHKGDTLLEDISTHRPNSDVAKK